jgi:hypothetical protein
MNTSKQKKSVYTAGAPMVGTPVHIPTLQERAVTIAHEIRAALQAAAEGIQRAGELYVDAVDDCPEIGQYVRDALPETPASMWGRLDRIGRGAMSPRLLIDFPNSHFLEKLTVGEQDTLIDGGLIDVYMAGGDHIKVPLRKMTPDQCKRVFARGHIRGLDEQKMAAENIRYVKQQIAIKSDGKGYWIEGGCLHVAKDCILSKEELRAELKKIEKIEKGEAI